MDRRVIIVEPKGPAPFAAPAPGTAGGITPVPGPSTFVGMSFKPLLDNDRVRVIRGRMEVGAREGFHTHASDIVVVHLSGGAIEDTAGGKTKVNHWKRGDVEFERVQDLLTTRARTATAPKRANRSRHPYVFKSLVFCGICGRKMQGQHAHGAAYYRCRFPKEYARASSRSGSSGASTRCSDRCA